MSALCFGAERARRSAVVVLVGLLVGALLSFGGVGLSGVANAAPPGSGTAAVAETSDEEKTKAARVVGVYAGTELRSWLAYSDENLLMALWEMAPEGSEVKERASLAYMSSDANAAAEFIKTGIFEAQKADNVKKMQAAKQRKVQRDAGVAAGISDERELERLSGLAPREFVFAVWQKTQQGSAMRAAADHALRQGSTEADWQQFITSGVFTARTAEINNRRAAANETERKAGEAEKSKQVRTAALQTALQTVPTAFQLTLADRELIGEIKDKAPGKEVRLAATHAHGSQDPKVWAAFLTTGVHEAHQRDLQAKQAAGLAEALRKTRDVLDAAKHDGFQPTLAAAAQKALDGGTLAVLSEFLEKGQHEALKGDIIRPTNGRVIQLQGTQSGRCLQVAGLGDQALANSAGMELWDCYPTAPKELWEVVDRGNAQYALKNANSKKCLDLAGPPVNPSANDNNALMVQSDCQFGASQLWEFRQNDQGVVEMRNVSSGKVLTAKDSGIGNATLVVHYTNLHAANQEWRVIDPTHTADVVAMKTGKIQLTGLASGRCLQVAGLDKDAKANLAGTELWDCYTTAPKQQWELIDKGENKYVLKNVNSGKCLDPRFSDTGNDIPLIQFDCHMGANQQWVFLKSGNDKAAKDSYRIRNVYTGKVIDVSGRGAHNGAAVVQSEDRAQDNQRWKVTWL